MPEEEEGAARNPRLEAVKDSFRPATISTTRRRLFGATIGFGTGLHGASHAIFADYAPEHQLSHTTHRLSDALETLRIATNRFPTDFDPHSAYDDGSLAVQRCVFEPLIRVLPGETDRYESGIAREWETDESRSVWTFRLNEGIYFHDGAPCDAAAVRASFERLLALDLAPATPIRRFVHDVSQIRVSDPATVVFDLGRPQPLFDAALASASGALIVNAGLAKTFEANGDWGRNRSQTDTDGLGCGPYRTAEYLPFDRLVFDQHAAYWRGWNGPHFQRITYRDVPEAASRRMLLERGEVDIADNLSPEDLTELLSNSDVQVDLRYNLTVGYVILNAVGPLQDPRARQALCYAFPYDSVISGVFEGYAKRAHGPCAELCTGFDPSTFLYSTDLERARELLADSSLSQGTTLTMIDPINSPWVASLIELFRANLERIGLVLETQQADYATLTAIYFGELPAEQRPHLMPMLWSPDYNDAWNHLWPQLSSRAWDSGNAGHYANAEVDALLDQAQDATSDADYQAAVSRIQQVVTRDDPAAIYVVQPQTPTVIRADVQGFVPSLLTNGSYDCYRLSRAP